MSGIELFRNDDFQVRSMLIDGEPWFVAADICRALSIANTSDALGRIDDDCKGVVSTETPGGVQQARTVNEAGMYLLVMRSDKAEAVKFRKWIASEVLPAIRKTGTYSLAPAPVAVMPTHSEALRGWAEAIEENERKDRVIEQLEPAAKFAVAVAGANGDLTVKDAAQILARDRAIKTGEGRLFKTLKAIQWIDKSARPYQRHIEAGRVAMKLSTYTDASTGEVHIKPQARITPKGLRELHVMLGGQDPLSTLLHPELPGLRVVS